MKCGSSSFFRFLFLNSKCYYSQKITMSISGNADFIKFYLTPTMRYGRSICSFSDQQTTWTIGQKCSNKWILHTVVEIQTVFRFILFFSNWCWYFLFRIKCMGTYVSMLFIQVTQLKMTSLKSTYPQYTYISHFLDITQVVFQTKNCKSPPSPKTIYPKLKFLKAESFGTVNFIKIGLFLSIFAICHFRILKTNVVCFYYF